MTYLLRPTDFQIDSFNWVFLLQLLCNTVASEILHLVEDDLKLAQTRHFSTHSSKGLNNPPQQIVWLGQEPTGIIAYSITLWLLNYRIIICVQKHLTQYLKQTVARLSRVCNKMTQFVMHETTYNARKG